MTDIGRIGSKLSDTFRLEHQMLVLDAALCHALDCQRYREITRRFIDDLLDVLAMEPLGTLRIYPAVDERAPGWSFIQPITTSHVSAHYFEKPGPTPHIRLDAYSCESVDWRELIQVCDRHFRLGKWRATFIDRQLERHDIRAVIDLAGTGSKVTLERALTAAAGVEEGESSCMQPAR